MRWSLRTMTVVAGVVVLTTLPACGSVARPVASPTRSTPTTFNITEANEGDTVAMHVGDILVVSMHPPAGYYNWTFTNPTLGTGQVVLHTIAVGIYPTPNTPLTSKPADSDDHRTLEAFMASHPGDLEIRAAANSVAHPTRTIDFHAEVRVSP